MDDPQLDAAVPAVQDGLPRRADDAETAASATRFPRDAAGAKSPGRPTVGQLRRPPRTVEPDAQLAAARPQATLLMPKIAGYGNAANVQSLMLDCLPRTSNSPT
jgi:hypothetical protein